MSQYVQDKRAISIESPLGPDVLLLQAFTGSEEMSRLFQYQLRLLSEKEGIQPQEIIGRPVTFQVLTEEGQPRFFNGYVSSFSYRGRDDRLHVYEAEVVPWLWFLTRTSDCRIFQNKSVVEVIQQIFSDAGFSDFEPPSGSHPKWEYCVQYRETDFNFVSRLMEQEGIFYFFKHAAGKHTLVMGDQQSAYTTIDDAEVKFSTGWVQPEWDDPIKSWHHGYRFTTGKWAHTDYNFETPSTRLMADAGTRLPIPASKKYEFYDFPGEYEKKGEGDGDVRLRMEEEETRYETVTGGSVCRSFSPGGKFRMTEHHSKSESNKGYVLTAVRHSADIGSDYLTGGEPRDFVYTNQFACIPDSVTFRPARVTRKPTIQGIQTAVVTGKQGEEIDPDKYGRVKVQFHWDREGQKDEKSSCWVRVAQPCTGNNWGAIHIPRIGQEVVVSFVEGDPDRPLIIGMVYNAEKMPPYSLPDNKTQTGVKTRSSKNGGADNFNELRFEDKKGAEEVYFHAEKDFNRVVENNDSLKVGFEKKNDGSQTIEIWKDQKTTIKTGDRSLVIELGNETTKLNVGSSTTDAGMSIELKVGANSIKIDQTGITIKGIMIKLEGQAMTKVEAPMTQVNGTGMLKLQGGVTMIN